MENAPVVESTSNVRSTTRLDIAVPAVLMLGSLHQMQGVTKNISFSSVHIEYRQSLAAHHLGEACQVQLQLPTDDGEAWVELEGRITRQDEFGLGVQFTHTDTSNYRKFKCFLSKHAENPNQLIQEMVRHPELSMNVVHIGFMKEELSGFITDAVNEIFIAFLAQDVHKGPTVIKQDFEDYVPPEAEATAVVNFNGALTGGIHLSAPMHVVIALANSFSGEEANSFTDPMVVDAFGEMANLITGGVQTRLSGEFENIQLTPPTVVYGKQYGIVYQRDLNSVKQYFLAPFGPFFVECFFASQ
ncbi:type IV pilus assembly PilZ [Magnetococcus marinus MC-1]|uniref:Type IV pilus assembly PilZ n=1 Tax=Magnetococcus marinus (strain ATCC BAA-1437 / JCM 17883 / MC-1) TaxID=156889 RepID=A0L7U6_MAGMM|nr:chemotaxis protein CheX [Magnetococcus marinus]ABK44039.1 type IV pilus assembly PilZ [Magnetococcus marinus MC-1]